MKKIAQARHYLNNAKRQAAYRQRVAHARTEQLAAQSLPTLPAPASLPGTHRWRGLFAQALWALNTMESEMQDYYEARSISWQEDEKGQAFLEKVEAVMDLHALAQQVDSDYSQ